MNGLTLFLFGFTYILGLVMGAALGSFVNMLTYRVKRGMKLGGRSFADETGKPLTGIDLIPIFSYVVFLGKSRTSGEKLPVLYPMIEFLSAIAVLFVFVGYYEPATNLFFVPLATATMFFTGVMFFASYDLQYLELPKKEVLIFAAFTLIATLLEVVLGLRSAALLLSGVVAAISGGLLLGIIYLLPKTGVSKKDIILTAAIGLFLGVSGLFWSIFLASLAGSVIGAVYIVRRKKLDIYIPYATILGFGATIYLLARQLF